MTALDRYLKTVRSYLPRDQQDDIVRELSENLRSQMEDREAELGRPLTEAEEKSILERHGDPLAVAGAYRQDQRSLAFGRVLVGPVLFPLYLRVLRINLGITFLVCLPIFLALHGPANILSAVPAIFVQLLIQFAIVTLIFTAVEHRLVKLSEGGDELQRARPPKPKAVDRDRVPRLESFAELVALGVFTGWLLVVGRSPQWVVGTELEALTLGPVWRQVFLPTVLVALAGMARAAVNLCRPDWTALRAVGRVVLAGAWLAVFGYLAMAGDWIVPVQAAAAASAETLRKVDFVNRYFFFYPLLVTAGIAAVDFGLKLRRLLHRRQKLVPLASVTLLAVCGSTTRAEIQGLQVDASGVFVTSTPARDLPTWHSATAPRPGPAAAP